MKNIKNLREVILGIILLIYVALVIPDTLKLLLISLGVSVKYEVNSFSVFCVYAISIWWSLVMAWICLTLKSDDDK